MNEPRLEDISDYNTLKGQKKTVVWTVVLLGLFFGLSYAIVANEFKNVDDALSVDKTFKQVPMK